jgi:uncharacterized Zn-finger protein
MVLMLGTVAKTFRTVETRIRQSWRCVTLSNPARHSPDIELSIPVLSTPNRLTPQELTCAIDQHLHQSIPSRQERNLLPRHTIDHDCTASDCESDYQPQIWPIPTPLQPRNRLYHCPRFSKAFPRPSSLMTHMNLHTGAKRELTMLALSVYMGGLTGFAAFRCAIPGCAKTFAVKSNMSRHMRTHGIPPLHILNMQNGSSETLPL